MNFNTDKIKRYPHFDAHLRVAEIEDILGDPTRVARNAFYPFILYHEEFQPFRSRPTGKPKRKERPIRYASRRDAYILAHYREILSVEYERALEMSGISECPIAYRRIKSPDGKGKSNIDFAKDAFDTIRGYGDCVAIAMDIKGYFESLDHLKIKEKWCRLLGVARLPDDHFAVFKNVTKYSVVDQKALYRRLGILASAGGGAREKFTVSRQDMPTQLCTPAEFREKVAGANGLPSIIETNKENKGIPQGAPISDIIANFYLLDFDQAVHAYVAERGGIYRRYSDDILLIVPGDKAIANEIEHFVTAELGRHGDSLQIKSSKTCIVQFWEESERQRYASLSEPLGRNGFEYLGFRYDGSHVFVRDSTISRLYRKMKGSASAMVAKHMKQNPKLDADGLVATFNISSFSERYARVSAENFRSDDPRTWSFHTYLEKAVDKFGDLGGPIAKQGRKYRKNIKSIVRKKIERAVAKRDRNQTVLN